MQAALPGLLLLAGCAAAGENWPNLAQRTAELQAAAPAPPLATPQAPIDPVIAGRIGAIERDIRDFAQRWQEQQAAAQRAIEAAADATIETPQWSAAQVELTRFDTLSGRLAELRDRLDAVAGEIAHAAAQGRAPGAALVRTGQLIGEIEALRQKHLSAFSAAQGALRR